MVVNTTSTHKKDKIWSGHLVILYHQYQIKLGKEKLYFISNDVELIDIVLYYSTFYIADEVHGKVAR